MEDKTAEYGLMLKMFPTSISPSRKCHEIFWLIKLLDVTMSMKFFCPHFPSSRDIKIHGDPDILALIKKYIDEFQEHCSNSTSVLQYMVNFTGFLKAVEAKIKSTGKYEEPVKNAEIQRNVLILAEIEKVGFDKVIDISQDLSKIQFGYKDSCSKLHKLDVLVPPDYPDETPSTISDLPEDSAPIKSSSFKDIYKSWIKSVEAYVPAWEVLEEVDRVCWVLDPDPPTPLNLYRRIAVGSSISLQIEIEPTDPTQLPQIK
ncbi:E3 ubiquitin-protein ligase FANCL [Eurytemora carolleeae]|uniref:E3 ubiquitin-protein ligase FANCL n=1 Tax=Eurytemora carolleeae TaxID=1294199 RepID=UPI000C75DB39|nr:E3 ubiquitin-protein ligase FANCL [Eurytemora carolleeae]|eukprot:XP_023346634.1 E3 ubiquitin-protein ligase FANCL-like [Eurytemora affinis]